MYIAHIRESDGKEQTLSSHCRNVAALCSRGAVIVGLAKMAELIGLMHDMGKATDKFEDYLRAALASSRAGGGDLCVSPLVYARKRAGLRARGGADRHAVHTGASRGPDGLP